MVSCERRREPSAEEREPGHLATSQEISWSLCGQGERGQGEGEGERGRERGEGESSHDLLLKSARANQLGSVAVYCIYSKTELHSSTVPYCFLATIERREVCVSNQIIREGLSRLPVSPSFNLDQQVWVLRLLSAIRERKPVSKTSKTGFRCLNFHLYV